VIPLSNCEKKVLKFMGDYWREYKNIPYPREIAEATGVPLRNIYNIEKRLADKFYLDRFMVGNRLITIIVATP
jgi:hypothetical protein